MEPAEPADIQLSIQKVTLSFGGVTALNAVSADIRRGCITAVIGPNGAGKTSLLNSVSGLYKPQQGEILYWDTRNGGSQAHNLIPLRPDQIARLGVARSFQNIELFRHMTVLDNLMLGRHLHMHTNVFTGGIFFGPARREEVAHRQVVEEIIDFLEIEAIRKKPVGTLAYGLQKRVELGRALALDPQILLLDEPMAGMNAEEKEDMARFVLDINEERKLAIVLIEHDMGVVMDISDWVVVLDFGTKIAEGVPEDVRSNPAVIQAYLGADHG